MSPLKAARGDRGAADVLFSKIIRARAGWRCENCGSDHYVQCCHVVTRSRSNTRTYAPNAFCLCASCHRMFGGDPPAWTAFVVDRRGEDGLADIQRRSQLTTKVDWKAERERLKAEWATLESQVAS